MIVPVLLFFGSLAALFASSVQPGFEDLFPLAAVWVLTCLVLIVQEGLRKPRRPSLPPVKTPAVETAPHHTGLWKPRAETPAPKWVVVDGSNVMHWKDNTPQIATVREVVDQLTVLGFTPGVVFDANAGYLLDGRYQHDGRLGRQLGLPEDRVMVVPKGTPADPTILKAARSLGARVVSNDRYRDWAEEHPEVQDPAHLIRGDYDTGTLRLRGA